MFSGDIEIKMLGNAFGAIPFEFLKMLLAKNLQIANLNRHKSLQKIYVSIDISIEETLKG